MSACNAGDPSSIPGLGRSTGEGIGYPLQYSWAFLVAQPLKNLPNNVGDLGSIPGLGRSPKEGKGYPLQYSCLENSMDRGTRQVTVHGVAKSWAYLIVELVKNPPAIQETWVRFLGWEDPLKKGKATHSSILAWRIPWTV